MAARKEVGPWIVSGVAMAAEGSPEQGSDATLAPPETGSVPLDTGSAPDATGRASEPPVAHRLRRPARALLTFGWLPLLASGVAIVLSLASIYVSTREPEVVVILPEVVRLVGGAQAGSSYVYLQPAFVSTGVNDRVEVIRDMSLGVRPADGSAPVEMAWASQAALETDANGVLSYRYEADAVPLLVGPRSAAAPLALFQAPAGWFFDAGTYAFTLEAQRVVAGTPLTATFEVTIDADDLAQLRSEGADRFLAFPIEDEA